MNFFSRLFGKKNKSMLESGTLVANPNIDNAISLSVLFKGKLDFDKNQLKEALLKIDPSIKNIQYETPFEQLDGGCYLLIGWDKHVIQLIGMNHPYPANPLEPCIASAHYSQDIKEQVRHHDSHLMLFYKGYEQDVFEQYLALARLAASFATFNALAVVNEHGHTSLPIESLLELVTDEDGIDLLSTSLPTLFCGFVKYQVENVDGVWMRTYGADAFGLPDFAVLAKSHDESEYYFTLFSNVLNYLRESGATMVAGDTMECGDDKMMSLRAPNNDESFLKDEGNVLVVEIHDSQVNS